MLVAERSVRQGKRTSIHHAVSEARPTAQHDKPPSRPVPWHVRWRGGCVRVCVSAGGGTATKGASLPLVSRESLPLACNYLKASW